MLKGEGTTDALAESTLITTRGGTKTSRTGKSKRLASKGRCPGAGFPVHHPSKDEARRQLPVVVSVTDAHDEAAHIFLFLVGCFDSNA